MVHDWPKLLSIVEQVRGKKHHLHNLIFAPLTNEQTNPESSYFSATLSMGLRMDHLHAPTVASGPSSGQQNGESREKLSLHELIAEKDRVWSELTALGSVLDSVSDGICAKIGGLLTDQCHHSTEST